MESENALQVFDSSRFRTGKVVPTFPENALGEPSRWAHGFTSWEALIVAAQRGPRSKIPGNTNLLRIV